MWCRGRDSNSHCPPFERGASCRLGYPGNGGKVWFRSTPRRSRFTGGLRKPSAFPSLGRPGEIRTPIACVLSAPSLPVGLRARKLAERGGHDPQADWLISLSRRMPGLPASRSLADDGGIEPRTLRLPLVFETSLRPYTRHHPRRMARNVTRQYRNEQLGDEVRNRRFMRFPLHGSNVSFKNQNLASCQLDEAGVEPPAGLEPACDRIEVGWPSSWPTEAKWHRRQESNLRDTVLETDPRPALADMVFSDGLEPPTVAFGTLRSVQLSYEKKKEEIENAGKGGRARTADLPDPNRALSRLSYTLTRGCSGHASPSPVLPGWLRSKVGASQHSEPVPC